MADNSFDYKRDGYWREPFTLEHFIYVLRVYEQILARQSTPERKQTYDVNSPETLARIQDYRHNQRVSIVIVSAPGKGRIQLLCEELDNSDGLTSANVVKLRVKVCRAKPCTLEEANALTLNEVADLLEGKYSCVVAEMKSDATPAVAQEPAPKRSTERGEGRAKLIAALTKHHQYADGSCLHLEPIGNNRLAKAAGVSHSTASEFFNNAFQGHSKYKVLCRDAVNLVTSLKLLNNEFAPHNLYGHRPADEGSGDDL